jgi:hypothetical protein
VKSSVLSPPTGAIPSTQFPDVLQRLSGAPVKFFHVLDAPCTELIPIKSAKTAIPMAGSMAMRGVRPGRVISWFG